MRGRVCRLQLPLVLASTVILGSESRETHDNILLSQIRDSPNLEGQIPVFISRRNRVAQLYPRALGSLFVTSYDAQGYLGGIRNRLPAWGSHMAAGPRYRPRTDCTENVSSIIARYLVTGETTCPQICFQATAIALSRVYTAVTWQYQLDGRPAGSTSAGHIDCNYYL
jgi:hypothetical protein